MSPGIVSSGPGAGKERPRKQPLRPAPTDTDWLEVEHLSKAGKTEKADDLIGKPHRHRTFRETGKTRGHGGKLEQEQACLGCPDGYTRWVKA